MRYCAWTTKSPIFGYENNYSDITNRRTACQCEFPGPNHHLKGRRNANQEGFRSHP